MKIRSSVPTDADALVAIWRAAVLATHDFLSEDDFLQIEHQVSHDYVPHAPFSVAVSGGDETPMGFMGISGHHIDSLFVHPRFHGQGVGSALLGNARMVAAGHALTVDVNEQNAQAVGFYLHQGFELIDRSPHDSDGRPYPILSLAERAVS
ncbi:acetyltransferase [Hydrogenophaga sp.]|uniref:acetyltransferase n=1 Tax=Hydrogenophaga sp. TaxID=1904254 RepID=UPI00271C145C|nr:acetyltransferase [Hydrogenophaga sp.]MDO9436729.1 acetyltransferase [Hydrogenophaga sp.]